MSLKQYFIVVFGFGTILFLFMVSTLLFNRMESIMVNQLSDTFKVEVEYKIKQLHEKASNFNKTFTTMTQLPLFSSIRFYTLTLNDAAIKNDIRQLELYFYNIAKQSDEITKVVYINNKSSEVFHIDDDQIHSNLNDKSEEGHIKKLVNLKKNEIVNTTSYTQDTISSLSWWIPVFVSSNKKQGVMGYTIDFNNLKKSILAMFSVSNDLICITDEKGNTLITNSKEGVCTQGTDELWHVNDTLTINNLKWNVSVVRDPQIVLAQVNELKQFVFFKILPLISLVAFIFIYIFSNKLLVSINKMVEYIKYIGTTQEVANIKIDTNRNDELGVLAREIERSANLISINRKRLEDKNDEAQAANKAKSDFLTNMSHELRTPLNAIIGFSGILMKKVKEPANIELSKQVNTNSHSLLKLINDILDLSKIKDSKFNIEPFEFNAYQEMEELSFQLEGLTVSKSLILNNKLSDNLKGIFLGDWTRINQICLNLISNAVKFTPKDGAITFSGDYKDGSLIISVIDNGIGMCEEIQNKIFEPFKQADGSTTRKYGGTGLGLTITQTLVELMDGKIELVSKENAGTTFIVTIPLEKTGDVSLENDLTNVIEEDKENTLTGHILIVEDNKTNQMLIKMLIEDFGLTCDIANDGLEAVEMYKPDTHELILMDENMPNMNGTEAMKAIREKHQDKCGAIITLTANAMQGDRDKFLNLGMDEYIAKPIDEDELYRIVKEFL